MARGILGDDGPTIFMALSVILIWNWVRDTTKKAGNAISDELDRNHASPLQSESTEDIEKMQKEVEAIKVDWSKLPKAKTYYSTLARSAYAAMNNPGTDTEALFRVFDKRTPNELRAIAKLFGVKEQTYGLAVFSGTLFEWFEDELSDGVFGPGDLTRMRKIWAKTGLWG